jgi:hypothetical protein
MVRHEYGQVAEPNAAIMAIPDRFNYDWARDVITKMIFASRLGASGDEKIRF